MSFSDDLLKAVGKALEQATPATRDNVIRKLKSEFVVNNSWYGYANLRVAAAIDSLARREVTHLKFTPLVDEGVVVIEVAEPDEQGAVEFRRSPTLSTGRVHMRAALADFDLTFADKRNMVFPVQVASIPVAGTERQVMLMRVKQPTAKKTISRPRKKKSDQTTNSNTNSNSNAT
jgi:hypothetical protein